MNCGQKTQQQKQQPHRFRKPMQLMLMMRRPKAKKAAKIMRMIKPMTKAKRQNPKVG